MIAPRPYPWRYEESGPNGAGRVVDAKGKTVIVCSDRYESVEFAEGALAVVLVAPQMEDLLRTVQWSGADACATPCCPICGVEKYQPNERPPEHMADCEIGILLAGIDKARAG